MDTLHWNCRWPDESLGGSSVDIEKDEATGAFVFRAPAGEIVLGLWQAGYRPVHEVLNVHPGKNEHVINLKRAFGIQISLREGGTNVPFEWSHHRVSVKQIDGDGVEEGSQGHGGSYRVLVSQPGLYEVSLRPVEGHDPVPPQRIQVNAGNSSEVVFELLRKQ